MSILQDFLVSLRVYGKLVQRVAFFVSWPPLSCGVVIFSYSASDFDWSVTFCQHSEQDEPTLWVSRSSGM